jgi:dephospho-CoA kinase
MRVIGLTGSIGMGKSTIAEMFRENGVPTHDADESVHRLMKSDGAAFPTIAKVFPQVIRGGEIDRQKLGTIVFNDEKKRRALEAIIHPLVRHLTSEFVRKSRNAGFKLAVLDIPLLFETGAHHKVDYTLCATAPKFIQKRRVLSREGMTEEKFNSILQSQLPDALKRCWSDFTINTARSKAQCRREVKKIIARVV